jgi:hypothetical protein
MLLAVAPCAEQQRQSNHAVEHDHHHREHRVACERGIIVAMGHHGRNAHDFDRCDRERQDQRAIGLAEPQRELFGVTHDAKRRTQHGCKEPSENERPAERASEIGKQDIARQEESEARRVAESEEPIVAEGR